MTGPASDGPAEPPPEGEPHEPRPWLERLGLAGIAVVFGALFAFVAIAAWFGGEPFLAVMGGIGCMMTLWVGALSVLHG